MNLAATPANYRLVPLREELVFYPGGRSRTGSPVWTMHDPLVNQFFHLGWLEHEILSRWSDGTPEQIAAAVEQTTTLRCGTQQVMELAQFLASNHLLQLSPEKTVEFALNRKRKLKQHWLLWLAKNYLFVRMPLVRPEPFLRRTLPYVQWLFGPVVVVCCIFLCVLGLVLVSRQFDAFINTFDYFFSLRGLLIYLLVLAVVKVMHELAHAYVSTKHGCRVSSMGIALLVLWPVLYTDTTESWKLQNRHQRMQIAAAGVLSEVFLAGFSLVVWSVSGEGMVRSAAFVLSTLTLATTLLINGNPMMRFDGYYLMSDWLNMPNLHMRSMALARWWLRKTLFGWADPPPEQLPRNLTRFLIVFAFCTMIYRFFLFLGIAFLVYYFFFKALGIILFVVEIAYFIGLPIFNEIKVWFQRRREMRLNWQTCLTLLFLLLGLGVLFVPWGTTITETATLRPKRQTVLTVPLPGRLQRVEVEVGDEVDTGELLFLLESLELQHELTSNQIRESTLQWHLHRVLDDPAMLSDRLVDQSRLVEVQASIRRQQDEYDRLRVLAPFRGRIAQLATELRKGTALPQDFELAVLVDWSEVLIETYLREEDLGRITLGDTAWFFPEDPALPGLRTEVAQVFLSSQKAMDNLHVASTFGGSHPAMTNSEGDILAVEAIYKVTLAPRDELPPDWPVRVVRGRAVLGSTARSPAQRLMQRLHSTFIREGNF